MSDSTFKKPVNIVISTPDGKKHAAQILEENSERNDRGRMIDGDVYALVSPALIGQTWQSDENKEDGEEPDPEWDYDLDSLCEWISTNVLEGGDDIEIDDSITGLSYEVLNRDDRYDEATTPLYVYGEMFELLKAKDESVWHSDDRPDVVATSDPVLARAISQLTPLLPSLIVELEGIEPSQLRDINKAPTHALMEAVRLETQRTKAVNINTSPVETVKEMLPSLKFLQSTVVDSLKRSVLNGHTPLENYNSFCKSTIDGQSSNLMNNASVSIGAEQSRNINKADILDNLPLVPSQATLVEVPAELGGESATAYRAQWKSISGDESHDDLLGIAVPGDNDEVTLYLKDYMKPYVIENVEPAKPELENKREIAPKI